MNNPKSLDSFIKTLTLSVNAKDLFDWHKRKGAFERLTPPWDPVEIIRKDEGIDDGKEVELRIKIAGIPQTLKVTHQNYQEGKQFEDRQLAGPFAHWVHTHKVEAIDEKKSELIDSIEYRLPMGKLGKIFGSGIAESRLNHLFHYRHTIMKHDLSWLKWAQDQQVSPKKVIISGASGLVGKNLSAFLSTQGHEVWHFTRNPKEAQTPNRLLWQNAEDPLPSLASFDWVIHLAGENVGQRWTQDTKKKIVESRLSRTQALAQKLAQEKTKNQVFFSASAIGYYGLNAENVDESAPKGSGFLAELCGDWEDKAKLAQDQVRSIQGRIGLVLSLQGGALDRLHLPFALGLGGNIGLGQRWMSWIDLNDLIGGIYFSLIKEEISGPVNLVTSAVSNAEFTKTLGKVLNRPTIAPIPPFVLQAMFGEMANETILASQSVIPKKLKDLGFQSSIQRLEDSFRLQLGK
jgi:uncharacterized protein (TIGR01777 family)